VHETGALETYELPVLTSRRGIILALLLVTAFYVGLYAATGIERAGDGVVISLLAVLLLLATSPFIPLNHAATRLIVLAPLCVPLFIAAATASSTTHGLLFAGVGLEVLVFGFLFLQSGTGEVTVRGVQRRRLVQVLVSFEEISGVKRFESVLGKALRLIGFGGASVELLLYSWKTVRFNIAPERVDAFIAEVSQEIDHTDQYDMFFTTPTPKTVVIVNGEEQEVKPIRRRGKKAKKLADQQKAATQTPTAAR
jgi:hypothetical protein